MLIDQSLSEAVIALQRHNLAPETREVVEEAARLLNEGREGEARALVEKAEALVGLEQSHESKTANGNGAAGANGNGAELRGMIAPLAAKLASGFTGVLTSVLEDIHRYAGDQIQLVAKSLHEHIEHMELALRNVAGVGERLELLANEQHATIQGMQHGQEELWAAVRALQQSDRDQAESITRVAGVADELSHHMVHHVEAVASRFAGLEERVSALDRFAQEMPGHLEAMVARLDSHTETLRNLEQRQIRRVSTLNQVLDSLARLKEPESPEMGLPAVA